MRTLRQRNAARKAARLLLFVRPLNQLGVRYIISGSVAAILYGEPRRTHDVDFVVFLRDTDIARLPEVFPSPAFFTQPKGRVTVLPYCTAR